MEAIPSLSPTVLTAIQQILGAKVFDLDQLQRVKELRIALEGEAGITTGREEKTILSAVSQFLDYVQGPNFSLSVIHAHRPTGSDTSTAVGSDTPASGR